MYFYEKKKNVVFSLVYPISIRCCPFYFKINLNLFLLRPTINSHLFLFALQSIHDPGDKSSNQNEVSQRNQLLLLFWYSTVCNSNIVLLYVYSSTHTSRNTKWIGISLSTRGGRVFFLSHIETRGKNTKTVIFIFLDYFFLE